MRSAIPFFIITVLLAANAAALTDYFEGFEDLTPPDQPDASDDLPFGQYYDYSTSGTGQFRSASDHRLNGTRSLHLNDTDNTSEATAYFSFGSLGWNPVDNPGSELRFAVMFKELPTFSELAKFWLVTSGDNLNQNCDVRVSSAGAVTVEVANGATRTTADPGITITTHQWFNVTIRDVETTGNDGCTFWFPDQAVITTLDSAAVLGPGATGRFVMGLDDDAGTVGRAGSWYLDNLQIINGPDPPLPAFGAAASITVTNLVGFDVSDDLSIVAAKVNGGTNATGYDPLTLAELGREDTQCDNRDEGIMTSTGFARAESVVLYLVCNAGDSGDVEELHIRNGALANPHATGLNWCADNDSPNNEDVCPSDVPTDVLDNNCSGNPGTWDDENIWRYMRSIKFFPANYEYRVEERSGRADSRAWAFAYTAYDSSVSESIVGVAEFTGIDFDGFFGCDDQNDERAIFSTGASATVDDLCSWSATVGSEARMLIGASSDGAFSRVYQFVPGVDTAGFDALDGSLSAPTVFPVEAAGMSCAGTSVLVSADDSTVRLLDLSSSPPVEVWRKPVTTPKTRGVHLSGDGAYAYWANGSQVHMAHAENGTEVATFTLPSSNYRDMMGDPANQRLYVAGSDFIARYDVQANLSSLIDFTCIGLFCEGLPSASPAPTGGVVGGQAIVSAFGDGLGIGDFGAGLLLTAVFVLSFAAYGAFEVKGAAVLGGAIGAVVGFLASWGFGFLNALGVFVVVTLIAAGLSLRFYFGRSNRQSGDS